MRLGLTPDPEEYMRNLISRQDSGFPNSNNVRGSRSINATLECIHRLA